MVRRKPEKIGANCSVTPGETPEERFGVAAPIAYAQSIRFIAPGDRR